MGASPAMAPLYPAGAAVPPELAWAHQANWPLTMIGIRPKWLGRRQENWGEHPARPRQAHGAAAPDPGAPGAADPRASADAREEAAGHAGAGPAARRQPGHRGPRLRGAGGHRLGARARG